MIQHRFPQNDPIPLFLAGPDKKIELSGVRKFVSSKLLKHAALVLAAVAIVCAVVSVANAILSARVTASPVSQAAPPDTDGPSAPAIQSTASVEAAPASQLGDELAAAIRSTREDRAEADRARDRESVDVLFNQFQTWAASEDAQARPVPQQPVQEVQAEIVRSPPLPRRRPVQVAHTARSPDSSPHNAPSFMQRFGFRN